MRIHIMLQDRQRGKQVETKAGKFEAQNGAAAGPLLAVSRQVMVRMCRVRPRQIPKPTGVAEIKISL
jgi:hypothetical protein